MEETHDVQTPSALHHPTDVERKDVSAGALSTQHTFFPAPPRAAHARTQRPLAGFALNHPHTPPKKKRKKSRIPIASIAPLASPPTDAEGQRSYDDEHECDVADTDTRRPRTRVRQGGKKEKKEENGRKEHPRVLVLGLYPHTYVLGGTRAARRNVHPHSEHDPGFDGDARAKKGAEAHGGICDAMLPLRVGWTPNVPRTRGVAARNGEDETSTVATVCTLFRRASTRRAMRATRQAMRATRSVMGSCNVWPKAPVRAEGNEQAGKRGRRTHTSTPPTRRERARHASEIAKRNSHAPTSYRKHTFALDVFEDPVRRLKIEELAWRRGTCGEDLGWWWEEESGGRACENNNGKQHVPLRLFASTHALKILRAHENVVSTNLKAEEWARVQKTVGGYGA
ncbi:hypothetical protein C8F04DRAFT_1197940 [Mycena alexandri]|uniref:Uncharacterized protein n=1 Tax=Mycena alexandri TaxID=1745969 RepID=A0AAD6S2E8_9AGAR|nr:hypothetical protein C8F04DRAFT_1197940 [Mycena alexandri]